jgi:glycosyltransferase involved in cell wall biosynthesis
MGEASAGAATVEAARSPRAARVGGLDGALEIAAVGVSTSSICGVRNYAVLLADALGRQEVRCSLQWLWRGDPSLRRGRAQVAEWTERLARELEQGAPDAVLLHYSVFTLSYRGVPLFVPATLAALRRARTPLVTILHEYAYPWRLGRLRGKAWAFTQRAFLGEVMRASSGALVTSPARARWLRSRPWLPRRPIAVAPVFSTLPPPLRGARPESEACTVGVFGYAYEGIPIGLVLDALERVSAQRGGAVQLVLIGAPGVDSPAGRAWIQAARARSGGQPVFTGLLPERALADAIARCDVLLFADPAGPTPRKTTLAGALSSGRPVVALDGPATWPELERAGAALLVPASTGALSAALSALLDDAPARDRLGRQGAEFAAREMSADHSAAVVRSLVDQVLVDRTDPR